MSTLRKKKTNVRMGMSDRLLNTILMVIFSIFIVIILYPIIFVISSSFSSGNAVSTGKVILWPVEFSTIGYQLVLQHRAVWIGYANSIFYTVTATIINIILTTLAAYPLSRTNLQGRHLYLKFCMVPMFFGGGLIPTYLLYSNLGLVNTRWIMLIAGGLSLYNMTMMRTYFQSTIPGELLESAKMDGITDFGYLMKVVIPLSKTIYAVITLYYIVGHWSGYFTSMIYLRDRDLFPLQLVLKDILSASQVDTSQFMDTEMLAELSGSADVMKFALVVISSAPMIILYPFVQKFFEKGVMIGSLKG